MAQDTIKIIRGDDEMFAVEFTKDGVAIDITGHTVFFTVKALNDDYSTDDTNALIKKTITTFTVDDDPTHGKMTILLTSVDTNVAPGVYYWDLQLKSPTGTISSVHRGSFIVEADVTRRTL